MYWLYVQFILILILNLNYIVTINYYTKDLILSQTSHLSEHYLYYRKI